MLLRSLPHQRLLGSLKTFLLLKMLHFSIQILAMEIIPKKVVLFLGFLEMENYFLPVYVTAER